MSHSLVDPTDAQTGAFSRRPRILVLLATHNGQEFLDEQLDSVLTQADVDVQILVSDDMSTDQTCTILTERADTDPRIALLEAGKFGSAATNFARLIRDADAAGYDAIALCDQDDIWLPGKLRRHFDILSAPLGLDGRGKYAAVSSNVTAFKPNGTRQLIVKNQTQQLADYAFESGGPGSTYLLSASAFNLIKKQLSDPHGAASAVGSHDWLIYALIRASGRRWFIDGEPSVDYRQHTHNVLGANEGWRQHLSRLQIIRSGSYRRDVSAVIAASLEVANECNADRLSWLLRTIHSNSCRDRIRLARQTRHLRRRRRDQLALGLFLALKIW